MQRFVKIKKNSESFKMVPEQLVSKKKYFFVETTETTGQATK